MTIPAHQQDPPDVTFEQAESFVEALVGFQKKNPKSPHARTHLQARLGRIPTFRDPAAARTASGQEARALLRPLAAYLRGVAEAIERACDEGEVTDG